MDYTAHLPFRDALTTKEQERLASSADARHATAGEHVHDAHLECTGFLIVLDGQLRAYILSEDGHEITLYRLLPGDVCLFSASCAVKNLRMDVFISAEKDTDFARIPADVYKQLMEQNVAVSNFTNELMASRMSDVMLLMEQIMWQSFDRRLAAFLIEESGLNRSDTLVITHEQIANHLGTAREVVTRMLRYFREEGLVTLTRGTVTIKNRKALTVLGT